MAQLLEFMAGAEGLVVGRFGLECDWGLLDISYNLADEVIANTPVVLQTYYGAPGYSIVTGRNKEVATRSTDDECGYSHANYWIDECDFFAPEQKEVSIGIDKQREKDLVERLCNGRVFRGGNSIFNTDGSLRAGAQITEAFVQQQAAQLGEVNAKYHEDIFWDGDPANQDQYLGIYDQLINGHTPQDQAQDCDIKALVLDWNSLTGGGGIAQPTDTITPGNDTFVVGPYTFSGMEGLNLVDVMLKWFRFLRNVLLRGKGEIMWEVWGPVDGVECVAEAAACTQPCLGAFADGNDAQIRQRVADAVRTLTVRLYPHDDVAIPILQTPFFNDTNRIAFGPRSVGRDLLRAWTFRPTAEANAILSGVFGDLMGRRMGSFDPTNFIPRETEGPQVDLEEVIFQSRHEQDRNCIESWITSCGAPLVFGQHLQMIFENVACEPSIQPVGVNVYNGESAFTETITACGVGATSTSLNIEFPDPVSNFTCSLGDMLLVKALDGTTYSATVTVINTTNPADIEVDFGFDVDCALSGGINGGEVTYAC